METMSKTLNGVWQGYLLAVGWVEDHPHLTFWAAVAAILLFMVL